MDIQAWCTLARQELGVQNLSHLRSEMSDSAPLKYTVHIKYASKLQKIIPNLDTRPFRNSYHPTRFSFFSTTSPARTPLTLSVLFRQFYRLEHGKSILVHATNPNQDTEHTTIRTLPCVCWDRIRSCSKEMFPHPVWYQIQQCHWSVIKHGMSSSAKAYITTILGYKSSFELLAQVKTRATQVKSSFS